MKKIILALLLFTTLVWSLETDQNLSSLKFIKQNAATAQPLTLDHIGEIGSILEPAAEILAEQINSFGTMLTIVIMILSLFAYASIFKPIKEKIDDIDKSIEDKVKNQVIYGLDDKVEKTIKYAEEKIDEEVKKVRKDAQDKIFEHQNLVYLVNQKMNEEINNILEKEDLQEIEKLKQITKIHYKYNDITNNYLIKLVNDDFETMKQTIIELSDYRDIKSVITMYLSDLCHNGKLSSKQKEEVKKLLEKRYDYKCDV